MKRYFNILSCFIFLLSFLLSFSRIQARQAREVDGLGGSAHKTEIIVPTTGNKGEDTPAQTSYPPAESTAPLALESDDRNGLDSESGEEVGEETGDNSESIVQEEGELSSSMSETKSIATATEKEAEGTQVFVTESSEPPADPTAIVAEEPNNENDSGSDSEPERETGKGTYKKVLTYSGIIAICVVIGLLLCKTFSKKTRKKTEPDENTKIVPETKIISILANEKGTKDEPGSCIGQGQRSYQEDDMWCAHPSENCWIFVISDGMGGMENGKASAKKTTETFANHLQDFESNTNIPEKLKAIADEANSEVYEDNNKLGVIGGSTLICVYLFGNQMYWISIGDSRIYLWRKGKLLGINSEHELENKLYAQLFYDAIELEDIRQIRYSEMRKLTSNIGRNQIVYIDNNFKPFLLEEGDRILLCSDGVSGTLSEEEIVKALSHPSSQKSCDEIDRLIQDKMTRGSGSYQDNYSAYVIAYRRH